MFRFIKKVFQEKCPNCNKGSIFKKASFFKIPEMDESCQHCGYHFEREPGYFIGAMYISYGLALAQGIIAYLLMVLLIPSMPIGWLISLVIFTIFIFSKKNYKWSRILYIYIFPW